MTHVIKDEDLLKGKVSASALRGKYIILRASTGMSGMDENKAMTALNMLAEEGWEYQDFILTGKSAAFLLKRT